MRKLAFGLFLVLCFVSPSFAQGQRTFATTVAAADIGISNVGSGIAYHVITWTLTGVAPTCQVKLEQGPSTAGPWTDLITAQTCTSNGQSMVVNGVVNAIRINVTVKSGAGSVSTRWNGYVTAPGGGGSVTSITGTSPIVATPNPITGAGTISCPTCAVGTTAPGTPTNSIQFNSAGVFGGIGGALVGATSQITLTSQTATSVPLTFVGNVAQTASLLAMRNNSVLTPLGLVSLQGDGTGDTDGFGGGSLLYLNNNNGGSYPVVFHRVDSTNPISHTAMFLNQSGEFTIETTADDATFIDFSLSPQDYGGTGRAQMAKPLTVARYEIAPNCTDSAGAAACGDATGGYFVIDAGTTSTVVSTTQVDIGAGNSKIFIQQESSAGLAAKLGIGACNTTIAPIIITNRVLATSFTPTVTVAPAVTPACYQFWMVN